MSFWELSTKPRKEVASDFPIDIEFNFCTLCWLNKFLETIFKFIFAATLIVFVENAPLIESIEKWWYNLDVIKLLSIDYTMYRTE